MSKTDMNIKILGAGGYLGSYLVAILKEQNYKVYPIFKNLAKNSETESLWAQIQNLDSDSFRVIINLSGKWKNATDHEIIEANHSYPRHVLEYESSLGGYVLWVQASSYFQLYKDIYGIDKDLYSLQKSLFSEQLKLQSQKSSNLSILDIFLPYITGPKEPTPRIFSQLALAKINNTKLQLSSGAAVMPLLDVRDAANFILGEIQRFRFRCNTHYKAYYPSVSRVASLKNHINESLQNINQNCMFGMLPDWKNEFIDTNSLKQFYKVNKNLKPLSKSFADQVKFLTPKHHFNQ